MKAAIQKILRHREVSEVTGLSRSTIYTLINNNKFPQRVALGSHSVGWKEADIIEWINSRAVVDQKFQQPEHLRDKKGGRKRKALNDNQSPPEAA